MKTLIFEPIKPDI